MAGKQLQAVLQVFRTYALVDSSGDVSLLSTFSREAGSQILIKQQAVVEEMGIALIAAAIVARAKYIDDLTALSKEFGSIFPKGVSHDEIIAVGRALVARAGQAALEKVAKLHFEVTESILQR